MRDATVFGSCENKHETTRMRMSQADRSRHRILSFNCASTFASRVARASTSAGREAALIPLPARDTVLRLQARVTEPRQHGRR